jgi:hypothetical protein
LAFARTPPDCDQPADRHRRRLWWRDTDSVDDKRAHVHTGESPAASPAASAAASPAASPAGSPSAATITELAGKWAVTAANPRVTVATGGAAGGGVTIEGGRYTFQAGDYKSSGPVVFSGEVSLDCNATRCRIGGSANQPIPPQEIRSVDGKLVVVSAATLAPYGTEMPCGHPSLPGEGVLTITRTTTIDGKEVPAEATMTGGTSGGVGNECSTSGWQAAWDLTATRLPG